MGSTVDDALSIVRVTILGRATLDVWLGRVVSVNKDGTTSAGVITARAATAAKSNGVVLLLVGANGVGTALDTLLNVDPGNIGLDIERLWALWRELQKLLHVEKLDAVAGALRSDDEGVLQDLHLAPDDGVVLGRKTTKVLELTIPSDLRERGTVGLTDGDEFTALVGPSPGARSVTDSITKLGVRLEVVQVYVLALVGLIEVRFCESRVLSRVLVLSHTWSASPFTASTRPFLHSILFLLARFLSKPAHFLLS